jgi:hypothetical protein
VDDRDLLALELVGEVAAATAPCWSSRPQVRNVFHMLRSVKRGFVEAGVIWMMPASW